MFIIDWYRRCRCRTGRRCPRSVRAWTCSHRRWRAAPGARTARPLCRSPSPGPPCSGTGCWDQCLGLNHGRLTASVSGHLQHNTKYISVNPTSTSGSFILHRQNIRHKIFGVFSLTSGGLMFICWGNWFPSVLDFRWRLPWFSKTAWISPCMLTRFCHNLCGDSKPLRTNTPVGVVSDLDCLDLEFGCEVPRSVRCAWKVTDSLNLGSPQRLKLWNLFKQFQCEMLLYRN